LRKLGAAWLSAVLISVSAVALTVACHSSPDVDGASVATVGSPTDIPSCAQVCNRLEALCGYAPQDCTDADGGGYCDSNITDPAELLCIGYGKPDGGGYDLTRSCQAAWDCVANEVPPDDEAGDDASDRSDDGGDSTDGASE
jgi:hypothetical protein